jgi:hypothetical protein
VPTSAAGATRWCSVGMVSVGLEAAALVKLI